MFIIFFSDYNLKNDLMLCKKIFRSDDVLFERLKTFFMKRVRMA